MTRTLTPADATGSKSAAANSDSSRGSTTALVAAAVCGATGLGILLLFVTLDLGTRGVREVSGHPRALEPMFGFQYWPQLFEVLAVGLFVVTSTAVITNSIRQRRPTIGALFFVASLMLYMIDPWGNWAPYAIYDPRLMHWPVNWPWAAVAPNIEPLFGMIGYFAFYLGPPLITVWLLKNVILPRTGPTSIIRKHPLISLTLITVFVGFLLDAFVEIMMIRTGLYTYLQVMPWGSVFVGTPYQFPLFWESFFTTIPFVFAALLWWRDDSGQTTAERLGQRWNLLRRMGSFGTLLLIFTALILGYLLYLVPYVVIHKTGAATGTAQPYRYCEIAVPDANGQLRLNGQPGPYVAGWWPGPYNTQPSRSHMLPADNCPRN